MLIGATLTLLLTGSGCDRADTRRSLAQCMLSPQAHSSDGAWNDSFIALCMESKGFVEDDQLTSSGAKCETLDYSGLTASCYRRDNSLTEWWYDSGPGKQPSN
ncbi:MAG: hypothetical protein ACREFD_03620 [Stellaceae bacterium]